MAFKGIVYLFLFLGLTSCMETSYRAAEGFFKGVGHNEIQLAPNKFRVNFDGNILDGKRRILDFTLLRSAEVTLENGFKYFKVINERNLTDTIDVWTPGTAYSSGNVYGNSFSSNTTYYGGGSSTYTMPKFSNTIVCYKKKVQEDLYDAAFVVKSIKKEYGIVD